MALSVALSGVVLGAAGLPVRAAGAAAAAGGGPAVTMTPHAQDVFFRGNENHLFEVWFTGGSWYGELDLTARFADQTAPQSAPSAATAPDGSTVVVFWKGPGGALVEAWQVDNTWHGPVDIGATYLHAQMGLKSAPSVAVAPDGTQLVFWQGADDTLNEAWYSAGSWHGPNRPFSNQWGSYLLASSPSVTVAKDGTEAVFWQGMGTNHLMELWKTGGNWYGPSDKTNFDLGGGDLLASSPAASETPDGSTQLVYWQANSGHLDEAWYTGGTWHGPVDLTSTVFTGAGTMGSPPSVAVTPDGSTQTVFWETPERQLFEAWYTGHWEGPVWADG